MTTRIRRGRRTITCARCHTRTTTRHPDTTLCHQCRHDTGATTFPVPITQRSKHDLDAWLTAGGAQ